MCSWANEGKTFGTGMSGPATERCEVRQICCGRFGEVVLGGGGGGVGGWGLGVVVVGSRS